MRLPASRLQESVVPVSQTVGIFDCGREVAVDFWVDGQGVRVVRSAVGVGFGSLAAVFGVAAAVAARHRPAPTRRTRCSQSLQRLSGSSGRDVILMAAAQRPGSAGG